MRYLVVVLIVICTGMPAWAQKAPSPCAATDKACLFDALDGAAAGIAEEGWRDSTWREMAKLLTKERQIDRALSLIDRIKTPDTRAMTIRGIGMAAAGLKLDKAAQDDLFARLTAKAKAIEHPPSLAIALTYVAMAQAFAGDDAGAMATATAMENSALRHKAFGETAEIQAERGDLAAAAASLEAIDDAAFRNKAGRTVSKIFADRAQYDSALTAAMGIDNPYQSAQALLYILSRQIAPEDASLE